MSIQSLEILYWTRLQLPKRISF